MIFPKWNEIPWWLKPLAYAGAMVGAALHYFDRWRS